MDVAEEKDEVDRSLPLNICRCCLADGCYKDISTEYYWLGHTENYEKMLKETFDVSISFHNGGGPSSGSRLICDDCINKLRDASIFKKKVLENEENFIKHLKKLKTNKIVENNSILKDEEIKEGVKEEYEINNDRLGDDTQNDFDCIDHDFDDSEIIADIKLENKDEDSDFELTLESLRTKFKSKNKKSTSKVKRKKRKPVLDDEEQIMEIPIKKKSKGHKSRVPNLCTIVLEDYKEHADEKRKLKENTLNLLLNSNICFFRHNRTKFKCFICEDTFITMSELRLHTTNNHTEKEITWKVKTLKMINLKKTDISDLKCKLCNIPCRDINDIKQHLTKSHKILFHDLDKEIVVPYRLNDDLTNLTCDICKSEFKAFNKLSIHMNTHFQNNVCDICGIGFPNLSGLNQHKRNLHREIVCKICHQVFNSSSKMQRHRIKDHKVVPRRKCPICDATFRYSEQLYLHKIEAHGFERTEFKCNYCDKIFLIEYTLKSHIKAAHFRQKKHMCNKCDSSFYSNYELTRHLNTTHVTEKNISCTMCNAKYKCISSLRRHLKSAVHRHV